MPILGDAMATIDVSVRRMSDLVELARVEIQGAQVAAIWGASDTVLSRAYATCPVDTGLMRSSLSIERRPDGIALYSDVHYARFHRRPFDEGIKAGIGYLRQQGYE